jgi:hypothetical protein
VVFCCFKMCYYSLTMEVTKIKKIVISALAVIVLVALYVVFDRRSKQDVLVTSNTENATSTEELPDNLDYTIEKIPPSQSSVPQPIPDLNRPITKSPLANVTTQDVTSASLKVKELQTLLKSNPANFPVWLDLATYQKIGGDYEGAVISWTYASRLAPTDYVALANLGNLYAFYMKDNAKSEMYYKQAIARDPEQSYLYAQLAMLYKDFFYDITKAKAIIEEGLLKIPNDPNLLELKASL